MSKTMVFTFGRFQPPTTGHQKLADKVRSVARKNNADYRIYGSSSHDPRRNPLDPKTKQKFMQQVLRDKNAVVDPKIRSAFDAMAELSKAGYRKIIMVAGGDRVPEFKKAISKYIGPDKLYDIDEFDVVSAGQRDPDAEGVEGMSASKMRAAAKNGKFDVFRLGLPDHITERTAKTMFKALQKSMGIREGVEADWFVYEEFEEFRYKAEELTESATAAVHQRHQIRKANLKRQHQMEKKRLKIQHAKRKAAAKVHDLKKKETVRLRTSEDIEDFKAKALAEATQRVNKGARDRAKQKELENTGSNPKDRDAARKRAERKTDPKSTAGQEQEEGPAVFKRIPPKPEKKEKITLSLGKEKIKIHTSRNQESDSSKREHGTSRLTNLYRKGTPGQR